MTLGTRRSLHFFSLWLVLGGAGFVALVCGAAPGIATRQGALIQIQAFLAGLFLVGVGTNLKLMAGGADARASEGPYPRDPSARESTHRNLSLVALVGALGLACWAGSVYLDPATTKARYERRQVEFEESQGPERIPRSSGEVLLGLLLANATLTLAAFFQASAQAIRSQRNEDRQAGLVTMVAGAPAVTFRDS